MQVQQSFIDQTFTKRECIHFVPVSRGSEKCGCGRSFRQHTYISDQWPSASSLSNGLQSQSWAISRDSQKYPTDSYGTIEFQGGAYTRKAQFLRLSFDTPPEDIMELLERHWHMERPKLVISVHGGLTNFELQPKLAIAFKKGLLKVAKTTGTWIITSGLNCGAVNYVAAALNEAGGSVRARRRLISIGIAPWGLLKNRDDFVGRGITVQYNSRSACTSEERLVTLNEMHTHFLLVDNCTIGRYGADVILRRRLEKYIGQQSIHEEDAFTQDCDDSTDHGRNRVPVVGVIVEGGILTVRTVLEYLSNKPPMPVVICDGSGRAADLIAFAHKYGDPDIEFPENVKEGLITLIRTTFSYDDDKAQDVYKELLECLKYKRMITVFRLGENTQGDIDHDILAALLKGQNLTPMDRLSLTLSWNRPDIAASDVFVCGQGWSRYELETAMMEALSCNRVHFIHLLLEHGVSMEKFLTFKRLEKLYNTRKGPPHTLLYVIKDVLPNVHSGYRVKLSDIGLVIEKLIGGDYQSVYNTKSFKDRYEQTRSRTGTSVVSLPWLKEQAEEEKSFQQPFNDLFVWAILTKRQAMALCIWRHGEEALAKALFAAKLCDALANEAADDYLEAEICMEFRSYSREFKRLALELLDQCYQTDNVLGLQLLTYELKNWGNRTCLSLAVAANHMEFLSHPCCQVLLADLWHGGMRLRKKNNLRILISLLIPPILFTLEFKTRDELLLQPQTENERQDMANFENTHRTSTHDHADDDTSSEMDTDDENAGLIAMRRRRRKTVHQVIMRGISKLGKSKPAHKDSCIAEAMDGAPNYGAIKKQNSLHQTGIDRAMKISEHKNKRHRLSITKRITEFYQAPITTFWSWTIAYLVFLGFYTYAILLRTQPHLPTFAEWYTIAFVAAYAIELLRRFCISDGKTIYQKFQIFFGENAWNFSTACAIMLFFIALVLRFQVEMLTVARILYVCDIVFWYVRILDILSVNHKLGPYITMIADMILSMLYIVTILMVTLVAYGVFNQSLVHSDVDEWTWEFLKNITFKPYFMWYGEVYENDIDNCHGSECPPGHWLAPIAQTLYLLITNILLINLLIAIFNNIYIKVNAISQTLWQFNRYAQVMEYEQKPWLPPPFIIIFYVYRVIKFTCFRGCGGNTRPTFDYRLKLFLKPEDIEKLLDFEEECAEDLQRRKNEIIAASADLRLQETVDRTAFISMKLDDVLAKQAAQRTSLQNLELELKAIGEHISIRTLDTDESEGTPSPISSVFFQRASSQLPSAGTEELGLRRGISQLDESDRTIDTGAPPSEGSLDIGRLIDGHVDRSLSSPWGSVPRRMTRTFSMASGSRGRRMSIIHGSSEYSSILDGIDVGECVPMESDIRQRRKSVIKPRLDTFTSLTTISSRNEGMEEEEDEEDGDDIMKKYEEEGVLAEDIEGEEEEECDNDASGSKVSFDLPNVHSVP